MAKNVSGIITYLIGYPGVGKYTIAQSLKDSINAVLVDNHMSNNPVFTIIGADGKSPIPNKAWDRVKSIRDILFDTIENVAPIQSNFILTNVLLDNDGDSALFNQVKQLAQDRGSLFVPVILSCEKKEHYKRVILPERSIKMKDVSITNVKKIMKENKLLPINHCNLLSLNNTTFTPKQSANLIKDHIYKIITYMSS
jgi:hypothetical protein